MKSITKVFLRIAIINGLVLIGIVSLGILAVIHRSFLFLAVALVATIIATFFASSSKFAKEVKWIIRWRKRIKRPMGEYPWTAKERAAMREQLYPELIRLRNALHDAKGKRAEMRKKCEDALLVTMKDRRRLIDAQVEVTMCAREFKIFWLILAHIHALPLNPKNNRAWSRHQSGDFFLSLEEPRLSMEIKKFA